jgi:hypothetical protein
VGYLTISKLNNVIDHGICLPSTELRQSDWLILASVKVVEPMKLRFRFLNLNIISATVNVSDITSLNKIFGNLGLAYVSLRLNYISGSPGEGGGLDVLVGDTLGIFNRTTGELVLTTPGVYTWLLASNMKSSSESGSIIPATTPIDFNVSVNGALRLELDPEQ